MNRLLQSFVTYDQPPPPRSNGAQQSAPSSQSHAGPFGYSAPSAMPMNDDQYETLDLDSMGSQKEAPPAAANFFAGHEQGPFGAPSQQHYGGYPASNDSHHGASYNPHVPPPAAPVSSFFPAPQVDTHAIQYAHSAPSSSPQHFADHTAAAPLSSAADLFAGPSTNSHHQYAHSAPSFSPQHVAHNSPRPSSAADLFSTQDSAGSDDFATFDSTPHLAAVDNDDDHQQHVHEQYHHNQEQQYMQQQCYPQQQYPNHQQQYIQQHYDQQHYDQQQYVQQQNDHQQYYQQHEEEAQPASAADLFGGSNSSPFDNDHSSRFTHDEAQHLHEASHFNPPVASPPSLHPIDTTTTHDAADLFSSSPFDQPTPSPPIAPSAVTATPPASPVKAPASPAKTAAPAPHVRATPPASQAPASPVKSAPASPAKTAAPAPAVKSTPPASPVKVAAPPSPTRSPTAIFRAVSPNKTPQFRPMSPKKSPVKTTVFPPSSSSSSFHLAPLGAALSEAPRSQSGELTKQLVSQYKHMAERLEVEKNELLEILAAQADQFYQMQAYIDQLTAEKHALEAEFTRSRMR
ncbi:Aste57867_22163 [Aphanomyces stellatus]|uniref:Aste57867_22163 protein n=1 Tax=Aphanomyces stellatus TaxID=120398 RepID=A0A485LPE7_9STRA|nr:hypothetical protein As57867_022094 [Aphanomyces stellatus]VFT98830.1 Aste57867_22163 [Aphanomyces stellatus]